MLFYIYTIGKKFYMEKKKGKYMYVTMCAHAYNVGVNKVFIIVQLQWNPLNSIIIISVFVYTSNGNSQPIFINPWFP